MNVVTFETFSQATNTFSPGSWEEVVQFDGENFPYPWTRQQWSELQQGADKYFLLVMRSGGRILGMGLFLLLPLEDLAHMLKIAVCRQQRSQGWGWLLWQQSLRQLSSYTQVFLEVETSNDEAVAFYLKCGLKIVGKSEHFYGSGKDAWRMLGPVEATFSAS